MSENIVPQDDLTAKLDNNRRMAHVVYAIQAVCLTFVVTYVIAVVGLIINYVKLPDVKGTWLESHYRWQIRTFWFGLLWGVIGFLLVFLIIGWIILFIVYIWLIYRIVKGWLYLFDKKPMK